ncbi:hypothetical protein CEXT_340461 [Caerostris extrusa]|uniref:Uncharacterized protein n=1 Tax=Caerostris extrusa TaxID=172846 RepID=A0AAV4U1M5_CAEEX|nr:hypothetical protein CEXT_340461 [Caerostris extrusa]
MGTDGRVSGTLALGATEVKKLPQNASGSYHLPSIHNSLGWNTMSFTGKHLSLQLHQCEIRQDDVYVSKLPSFGQH